MHDDLAEIAELLTATTTYASEQLEHIADRPVVVTADAPASSPLLDTGAGLSAALDIFADRWAPGFSASAGPRYLGFVTGGATPAALAGDWMTSVFDQNALSAVGSHAAALERETIDWLLSLLGLDAPDRDSRQTAPTGGTASASAMHGAFVTGATMSNFVGLATAREWLGERHGYSVAQQGVRDPIRALSGAAHSSIGKALSMLGMGRDSLVTVPTLPDREAVDIDALERELAKGPAIVVANAGTVNTVDFDDIRAIADLKDRYAFWLHVDAAFGGFAAVSPAHAHLLEGWTEADSICVDLHKWLNVPYDSAVQFTRHPDLQRRVFENGSAYLGEPGATPDYMHLTPENSRRLRALPAWFTLAAYGRAGYREVVERNVAGARELGDRLDRSDRWRLLAPVRLNVVCFTLAEDPTQERVADAVAELAASGEVFVSPTVYEGTPGIRAAFSNWRTTRDDLDRICAAFGV